VATCFSHPAVPLAVACWAPSLRRPSLLLTASLLSAAPDLDAIGFFLGVPYEERIANALWDEMTSLLPMPHVRTARVTLSPVPAAVAWDSLRPCPRPTSNPSQLLPPRA
jgi:hypothetical protein